MVLRLFCLIAVVELIAWFINLYQALSRPIIDWREAAAAPLLVVIFTTLLMLERVRNRVAADPTASPRMETWRYVAAGFMVAGLVAAFILGFQAQR
jgi:hypothetical protein